MWVIEMLDGKKVEGPHIEMAGENWVYLNTRTVVDKYLDKRVWPWWWRRKRVTVKEEKKWTFFAVPTDSIAYIKWVEPKQAKKK